MLPNDTNINKKLLFIADPEIVAIPIEENHEPLIDLKDQKLLAFGPSPVVYQFPALTFVHPNIPGCYDMQVPAMSAQYTSAVAALNAQCP